MTRYTTAAERMAAEAPRPKSFPKRLRVGRFTAMFRGVDGPVARWEIYFEGKVVGVMHEGDAYGWGKPCFSLNRLVWAGPFPEDCSDSRSPNYGMCFDGVAFGSYRECLEAFVKSATRLMDWRRKHARTES